ncbi:MAG: hypothetical protein O3C21_15720 [Verrucomicrobia bacterium]|nr:hypothetical protein [Verrucomicrobiota bacterium]
MPTNIEILRAKARSFKSTLRSATPEEKKGHAGIGLAENFNRILADVGEAHPDLKDSLPAPLTLKGAFSEVGKSDTSYLDLEILADQLLALLDLVEN